MCRSGISRARSFDLEVTPWAPTRLTSSIFHLGHTEAYEPLRSTRRPARAPFNHLAAPGSAHKPPVCRSGISRARSFDLEVTPWAPTRLTSSISRLGPEESSGAPTLSQAAQARPGATSTPRNRPASLRYHSQHHRAKSETCGRAGCGLGCRNPMYHPSRPIRGLRRTDLGPSCADTTLISFPANRRAARKKLAKRM